MRLWLVHADTRRRTSCHRRIEKAHACLVHHATVERRQLHILWILRNGFQIRFLMGLIHLEIVYPWFAQRPVKHDMAIDSHSGCPARPGWPGHKLIGWAWHAQAIGPCRAACRAVSSIQVRAHGSIFVPDRPEKHGGSIVPVPFTTRTLDGGRRLPAARLLPAASAAAAPAGRREGKEGRKAELGGEGRESTNRIRGREKLRSS
jgi:hypothetical protein